MRVHVLSGVVFPREVGDSVLFSHGVSSDEKTRAQPLVIALTILVLAAKPYLISRSRSKLFEDGRIATDGREGVAAES